MWNSDNVLRARYIQECITSGWWFIFIENFSILSLMVHFAVIRNHLCKYLYNHDNIFLIFFLLKFVSFVWQNWIPYILHFLKSTKIVISLFLKSTKRIFLFPSGITTSDLYKIKKKEKKYIIEIGKKIHFCLKKKYKKEISSKRVFFPFFFFWSFLIHYSLPLFSTKQHA